MGLMLDKLRIFLEKGYPPPTITAVLQLTEEGCTVPFIARYRKERTGHVDEAGIRDILTAKKKLDDVIARQSTIISSIESQGQLTETLKRRLLSCFDPVTLEDLYLPFKKRRKSKADLAREAGLEGLAKILMSQSMTDVEASARTFLNSTVRTTKDALSGARHIIAEWLHTDEQLRDAIRHLFLRQATLTTRVRKDKIEAAAKYRDFFQYSEKISRCPSHRFLAAMRGEKEGFLQVSIRPDQERAIDHIRKNRIRRYSPAAVHIEQAIQDAYTRLMAPSLENQTRLYYKEKADMAAIEVFASNVQQLLLSPPLGERSTLAIDPGYRTGCKVACLDRNGKLLSHTTIYPHPPQRMGHEAREKMFELISRYEIAAIGVGDGTAGKETLHWLRKHDFHKTVEIHLVNEDGASIYSASDYARAEFPDLDITVRGAISIGRRLMDPMAELIKIDAKSIGVGQYQHDVNQKWLDERLDATVVSCVNSVGINLNTASTRLLQYVSGLGPTLAANIIDYRDTHGPFEDRKSLKNVPRLGEKAYEQASGFLRIRSGKNPLDNTGVHPESYSVVRSICQDLGLQLEQILGNREELEELNPENYATDHHGLPTIKDIINELKQPGSDVRGLLEETHLRTDINDITDLKTGMKLTGKVKNITDFGAFIDLGIKEAGLLHISEIADEFIQHPGEKLAINQLLELAVIGLDLERRRIQLSIKQLKKS